MQINSLKLLSKFHAATPKRSRVISKSPKFPTYWFENGRVKTKKTLDASVGHSNNLQNSLQIQTTM